MTGVAVRVVRGCWRLRRVTLEDVRLLAMSDKEFAAYLARARAELATAEATLARIAESIAALTTRKDLRPARRDAVGLMLAARRDDWEMVREILRPYAGNWTPLVNGLLGVAVSVGEELVDADRFEEVLEDLALELAAI